MRGILPVALLVCGVCLTAFVGLQAVLGEPVVTNPPASQNQGTMQDGQMQNGQMASGEMKCIQISRLIGLHVLNDNQEKLGKIEDLVIDANTGKVHHVILSTGSVMGMGGKMLPVPWNALQTITKAATTQGAMPEVYCTLNISKDALQKAPSFASGQWPNFRDQTFVATVEEFYRPYVAQRQHRGSMTR
jgi:sporulation protein YlmC with PRC-barrel domain